MRHANPVSIGFNCALGAKELRQYVDDVARIAPLPISAYPNAGLPNDLGGYDDTPEQMAAQLREWADSGLVNLVGGCCGTTPDHIRAIADAVRGVRARAIPEDRHTWRERARRSRAASDLCSYIGDAPRDGAAKFRSSSRLASTRRRSTLRSTVARARDDRHPMTRGSSTQGAMDRASTSSLRARHRQVPIVLDRSSGDLHKGLAI